MARGSPRRERYEDELEEGEDETGEVQDEDVRRDERSRMSERVA